MLAEAQNQKLSSESNDELASYLVFQGIMKIISAMNRRFDQIKALRQIKGHTE